MREYAAAVRRQLEAGELDSPTTTRAAEAIEPGTQANPAQQIADSMPSDGIGEASSGIHEDPFVGRDPIMSLLQTSIEAKLHDEGLVSGEAPAARGHGFLSHLLDRIDGLLHPQRYGPGDPGWVTEVAEAMLERLALGNHPFNPVPAEHEIADNARVVVVGDWGSGLGRAREVARFMAEEVRQALADGRQAHVVHLGDVYYSGDPKEYDRHVLDAGWWPVTAEQADGGVTSSWSLNGNHDMYSGGWGYFDHLLADRRFGNQSANGSSTSFFRLKSPSWSIVGLDTSWDPNVLTQGHTGVLRDPQAEVVSRWAGEDARKLMLLSHHQFVTAYDPRGIGADLQAKLAALYDSGRITAWMWGHEHRCMGFATPQVEFLRCIGHGGVPVRSRRNGGPLEPPAVWEVTGHYEDEGREWGRFGFAVLDFAGDHIDVRYRDDQGNETRREAIA